MHNGRAYCVIDVAMADDIRDFKVVGAKANTVTRDMVHKLSELWHIFADGAKAGDDEDASFELRKRFFVACRFMIIADADSRQRIDDRVVAYTGHMPANMTCVARIERKLGQGFGILAHHGADIHELGETQGVEVVDEFGKRLQVDHAACSFKIGCGHARRKLDK